MSQQRHLNARTDAVHKVPQTEQTTPHQRAVWRVNCAAHAPAADSRSTFVIGLASVFTRSAPICGAGARNQRTLISGTCAMDRRCGTRMLTQYSFKNLCGTVYRSGNVAFSADGNELLSPVGNRVAVFNLVEYVLGMWACGTSRPRRERGLRVFSTPSPCGGACAHARAPMTPNGRLVFGE